MHRSGTPQAAETIALKALAYLANSEEDFLRFINESGADAAAMRKQATDPAFLAAVLDFILGEDRLVLGFCDAESLTSEAVHRARHALPGASPW